MRAGTFNQRVTVERKYTAREANFGGEKVTWVTHVADWPVSITEHSGVETLRQEQRVMTRRIIVQGRWLPDVTTDMRLRDSDGRIYQIVSAVEVQLRRGLTLTCEEYSV